MAHSIFVASYAHFRFTRSQQIASSSAHDMKGEMLQLINDDLIGYLYAMLKVRSEDYSAFTDAIEGIVKSQNVMLRTRKTISSKSSTVEQI
ncbi:MAG: hypothetical protein ACK5IJ_09060 [Mangrovibacterium sp.]